MYTLKLETHFSAAHQLKNAYSKDCNDFLHGHNWKIIIRISVKELIRGMVIDFKQLKDIIKAYDHKNLNDICNFEPTAENLAEDIHYQIEKVLDKIEAKAATNRPYEMAVTVIENEGASITYKPDKDKDDNEDE